jgi:hypothetical protein
MHRRRLTPFLLFDADAGATGGGGEPAPPAAEGVPQPQGPQTFSQDDVDRIVGERLARERQKFQDYDDLRERAAKLDELEQAQKSELERAQETAQQATARAEAAEQRAATALRRSAIVAAAQQEGAVDPDAVLALIDTSQLTIGDDDRVSGAEEAVRGLLEAKPYLVGNGHRPAPGDGGARPQGPANEPPLDQQISDAERAGDWNLARRLKAQKINVTV